MKNTWLIGRECKRGDALSGPALIGRGLDQQLRARLAESAARVFGPSLSKFDSEMDRSPCKRII